MASPGTTSLAQTLRGVSVMRPGDFKRCAIPRFLLFLGLLACGYLKIDTQLYTVFAACLVGKSGVFNWGNAKEHDALAKVDVAKAALPVVPGQ